MAVLHLSVMIMATGRMSSYNYWFLLLVLRQRQYVVVTLETCLGRVRLAVSRALRVGTMRRSFSYSRCWSRPTSKRPRRYLRQTRCPAAEVQDVATAVRARGRTCLHGARKARRRRTTGRRCGRRVNATLSESISVHWDPAITFRMSLVL